VGNQRIHFPELARLADRQLCVMLDVSVNRKGRAWGQPATPGPVGSDVFIELAPGQVVSTKRQFFASSRWFRRGETAQIGFHVDSANFRQAAEAKKTEGILLGVWSGRADSGSVSLRID
jgi:hypothetical protein